MNTTLRVAIADQSEKNLAILKSSIENLGPYLVSLATTNGNELIRLINAKNPDLLLLHFQLSVLAESGGSKSVKQIRSLFPNLKIIMIGVYNNFAYLKTFIHLGVNGIVLKNGTDADLFACIEFVRKNADREHETFVTPSAPIIAPIKTKRDAILSDREIQIVQLICNEATSQDIADQLFLSKKTIDYCRNEILKKINVKNSIGIVKYAISNGLTNL